LIVAGSLVATFTAERNGECDFEYLLSPCNHLYAKLNLGKVAELERKQAELTEVNKKQEALAHAQTDFENLKPDIALICDRLALFAQIWVSVGAPVER
jgi:hypothetical protein